jgi:hypothetical protein
VTEADAERKREQATMPRVMQCADYHPPMGGKLELEILHGKKDRIERSHGIAGDGLKISRLLPGFFAQSYTGPVV